MSDLTQALGGTHEFKHKDKVYKASLITQKVKAEYQKRFFSRAKEAAIMLKECMTSKEYQNHLKGLNDDFIAGNYGFDSQAGIDFAQSNAGAVVLISLLFGISEDEVLVLVKEAKDELITLLQLIVRESFGMPAEETKE